MGESSEEKYKRYKKENKLSKKEKKSFEHPGELSYQKYNPKTTANVPTTNTQLDTAAYDKLTAEATRSGPSAWRQMMDTDIANRYAAQQDILGTQYGGMRNTLALQLAGQTAQAQNDLAMRGGLRGGSAERLAQSLGQQGLLAKQGLAREQQLSGQNLGLQRLQEQSQYNLQDEATRQAQLAAANNLALSRGQFGLGQQQWNIANKLNEMQQKRAFDLAKYQNQMQGWAAGKDANANTWLALNT